jgi:hypothetical protein
MRDAVTGQDGIFYFYNVPPGKYTLEVQARQVISYPIEVKPGSPNAPSAYQDIPEITLPSS